MNNKRCNGIIDPEIELRLRLMNCAEKYAQSRGRNTIQPQDFKRAIAELPVKNTIPFKDIKLAINNGIDYLKNHFAFNSAWDASMLIVTLLDAGENPNSEEIINIKNWLLDNNHRTDNGLWYNPEWKVPNVFDTSFAVVALSQLVLEEEKPIISNAIKFLRCSFDPCKGWQSVPGIGEIDVGATSWAIIALIRTGFPRSDTLIDSAVNWLKENQRHDGGWGYLCKKHSTGSYVTRTYDAIMALSEAGERSDSETIYNATNWLIEQHVLWTKKGDGKWDMGWEGYRLGEILVSAEENTITAVLALLKLGIKPNTFIVQAGINTILNKQKQKGHWHRDTLRAILCLNKFSNNTY